MTGVGSFAAAIIVKGALVLALAAATVYALRRKRAAARHQAWALGLLLAGALPALALSLPALNVPFRSVGELLPAPGMETTAASALRRPSAPVATAREARGVVPAAAASRPRPTQRRALAPTLAAVFSWLWAIGSCVLLTRLAAGAVRARALIRRGRPLDLPELETIRRELAIEREVRLVESGSVPVPMTSGVLRPILVVPEGFAAWSAERRRFVLLHELAHVRRHDWVTQLLSEIALALQWFQPLAWLAARRLREEAEVAADDVVVGSGALPSTYASHLLAIVLAQPAPQLRVPLAVAMGATPLERRLRRLLAPGQRRGPWRWGFALPVLALAVTLILATARIGAAPPEPEGSGGAPPRSPAPVSQRSVTADDAASTLGHYVLEVAQRVAGDRVREQRERVRGREESSAEQATERGASSFERAQKLHAAGDYPRASVLWEEAVRLGYRRPTAMYNLACALARMRDKDLAVEWLERALDEGFDVGAYLDRDRDLASLRSDGRFQKLRDEYGGGDRARALKRLARLEQTDPKTFDAWYGLGKELHEMGAYDAAMRAWRRSLEIEPGSSSAAYNIACAQALEGDTRAALESLERAIELGFGDPEFLERDEDLDVLRTEERYEELLETLRTLDLPDGAGSWFGWRPSRSEWSSAKARYQSYLEANPKSGRAWFNLGFAHLRLGESQAAADAYERAFSLGHRPGPTAYNVACSYAQKADLDRAFAWLERAREAGFDDEGMLASDPDLDNLRDDPRFPKTGKRSKWKHEVEHEEPDHDRHKAI